MMRPFKYHKGPRSWIWFFNLDRAPQGGVLGEGWLYNCLTFGDNQWWIDDILYKKDLYDEITWLQVLIETGLSKEKIKEIHVNCPPAR